MNTTLVQYDAARKALAAARAVDEVSKIRNTADAWRAAARIAKNFELELDAAEIRIRAERRLGELISQQKKTVGLNTGAKGIGKKKSVVVVDDRTPATLKEADISKDLSSRSQKLAAVPEKEFERDVKAWRGEAEKKAGRVTVTLAKNGSKLERSSPAPLEFNKALVLAQATNALMTAEEKWPDGVSVQPLINVLRRSVTRLEARSK